MGHEITVNAVDRSDVTRYPGTVLSSAGFNGEPGSGQVIVDDVDAALAFPSLKIVRWTEDASGSDKHLFRGRVIRKALDRGGDVAEDARQFSIDVSDSNWDLRRLRVHQWSRPAETGRARIVALGAYILNGASSTVTNANYRTSTDIDVTTYVPDTNTVGMDAKVYDATDPWSVIDDCARAEGKVYFVFIDDAGDMFLWFDVGTSTSYASTLSITDDDPNLTTEFPPENDGSPGEEDGSELLSGGALVPAGGILSIVAEARPSIATAHDVAEETFYDSGANSDAATRLGFFLDEREDEEFRYRCSVTLPDEQAHLIKAGMTISFRWAAAGVTTPIIQRVVRCGLELIEPDRYKLHLELGFPEKLAGRIRDVGKGVIQNPSAAPVCGVTGCDYRDDMTLAWDGWTIAENYGDPAVDAGATGNGAEGVLTSILHGVGPTFYDSPVMQWDTVLPNLSDSSLNVRVKWRIITKGVRSVFQITARDYADVAGAVASMRHSFNPPGGGNENYSTDAPNTSTGGQTHDFTWAVQSYYSQMRMTQGATLGKVWIQGDVEPPYLAWASTGTPFTGTPILGFRVYQSGSVTPSASVVAIDSVCVWGDDTDCVDLDSDSAYFARADDPRFQTFVSEAKWGDW